MQTEMTTEKLLRLIYEQQQLLISTVQRQVDAGLATARATRNLADGLSHSELRQQSDDRELARVEAALAGLIAVTEKLRKQSDPSTMTAEQLAAVLDFNLVCRVRQIIWARNHVEGTQLAPLPNDLTPTKPTVHASALDHPHRRKDDSITFKADKKGGINVEAQFELKTVLIGLAKGFVKSLPYIAAIGLGIKEAIRQWSGL